jgi:DUF1365 family protein
MESCIYTGHVRHRRFMPAENSFRYGLFMVYTDLAELDVAFRASPLWSVNRPNLACLLRRDHFGDPETPLDTSVRSLVRAKTGKSLSGPIRLLCHFRYFGHCFNPGEETTLEILKRLSIPRSGPWCGQKQGKAFRAP